ncbi:amidase [soil metagenome]
MTVADATQREAAADDHGAWVPGERVLRPPIGEGSLSSLRLAVKDLIDIEGAVTGGGNPDWAALHGPALCDAPAVRALRAAGASIVGKTITDELAFSLEGDNAHHGTPRNPRAPGRLPGGSSSGSAVAVAAGLADIALGTDTGGSVRVPASFCGVFGFRPTHGVLSLRGVLPFAPSFDTVGWFARDAALLERVGQVLLPRAGSTSNSTSNITRLILARDVFALADGDASARLLAVAKSLGAEDETDVFDDGPADWLAAYATLQGAEIRTQLGEWIAKHRPRFGPSIAPRFEGLAAITDADITRWLPWRSLQSQRLRERLAGGVALLLPTTPGPALLRSASAEERGHFYTRALAINALAGHAGLPQITLPMASTDDGAPLGLSLIGAPGSDAALLAFAAALGPVGGRTIPG